MRSDFLGEFQAVRALHDPEYDHDFAYVAMPVDPMPERHFVIIRGPARLAGLRLEDGLVEAMVGDTATRDALPLLAFTLRRLYDRYGKGHGWRSGNTTSSVASKARSAQRQTRF